MNQELDVIAKTMRLTIIEMLYKIGLEYKGHPGPSLSIVELLTCLYFKIMKIDPKNPDWEDRDRFILSKGHACPALYAALFLKGYFEKKHLFSLRHINSILQGHPDMRKTPGVDMTAGSLGNGLAAGIGMALSACISDKSYKTYVLIGDGEMQEGLVWEAAMAAGHYQLENLVAIIDRNRWQSCDRVDCTVDIEPLMAKLISFNWNVLEIDGHNFKEIFDALSHRISGKPLAVIANTVKGKGISFMEEDNSWHQRSITKEEYESARAEICRGEL